AASGAPRPGARQILPATTGSRGVGTRIQERPPDRMLPPLCQDAYAQCPRAESRSVASLGQEALMAAAPPRHFLHQNRLLRALTPATVQQVLLTLQPLALRNKDTLIGRDEPITAVYFPLDAVVSIVSTLADGSTLEVATIGNEGVVGLPCFLQGGSMPFTAFVQVPGAALKMEAEVFAQAVEEVRSDSTACWRATLRSGARSSGSMPSVIA